MDPGAGKSFGKVEEAGAFARDFQYLTGHPPFRSLGARPVDRARQDQHHGDLAANAWRQPPTAAPSLSAWSTGARWSTR